MSRDFIAPIQVTNLYVVDSDFHIEDSPSQNMELKVDVCYQDVQLRKSDGCGYADLKMCVRGNLVDKDDSTKRKMNVGATVSISVSAQMPAKYSDDEARHYLLSNAISMAYAHAKSFVMVVTGLSPMGALTLPAILPAELSADCDVPFQVE